MESKIEIAKRAKSLIGTVPLDAIVLYEQLWNDFNEQFNAWDALFFLMAMRKHITYNSVIINDIVKKFKEDEKVSGIYSWYIFDKYIKKVDKNEMIRNENIIRYSFEIAKQKDLSEKQEFPCPFTIAVFKLIDAHADNQFNAKKINELLRYLNPELLSPISKTIKNEKKEDVELSSDKEKYYALNSKALCKLAKYKECIEISDLALSLFKKFHYNNDVWFLMRKAISYEKTGNAEMGEQLFQEILTTRAGSDKWFLYFDIAELYFELKSYEKAWKYSIDSAYYGNEPEFMVNLYLLQARILFKLNRQNESTILANLLASIFKELNRQPKPDFQQLFQYYKIQFDKVSSIKDNLSIARNFWNKERYKNKERNIGVIINIIPNGKKGKIKSGNNTKISFSKKDFRERVKDLTKMLGANVEYYLMTDFKDNYIAEDIVILGSLKAENSNKTIVGRVFKGKIKSIKEFGIFITIPNSRDGLLHKSSLPKKFQENFMETFSIGDEIGFEVVEVTQKGISLKYVN